MRALYIYVGMDETELKRLKIVELRNLFSDIPKRITKKSDIVQYIMSSSSQDMKGNVDDSPTIASIFAKSKKSVDPFACRLCTGDKSVWCELGLVKCPVCCPQLTTLVKQEEPESSIIRTHNVDLTALCDLVCVYGYGICESVDALRFGDNSVETAVAILIDKTRMSADNYQLEQAQLISEESSRGSTSEKSRVISDISEFTEINPDFAHKYIFQSTINNTNGLLEWIVDNPTNSATLYDYLLIRRDSIKWYKKNALKYFEITEPFNLATEGSGVWLSAELARLRDALYNIPESSGSIPEIFRSLSDEIMDEDIEFVVASEKTPTTLLVIEDDDSPSIF